MKIAGRHFGKPVLLAALLASALHARATGLELLSTGNLLGTIVDAAGLPQSGASVRLFNKFDRLVARTTSTIDGRFAFAALPADSAYSVRVSLETFVPAFRDKIIVRPGLNSMLQINLATLFSSIQINSALPVGSMSKDWKWVLRTSPATRPITRLLPEEIELGENPPSESGAHSPRLFSGTHMLLGISGGDAGLVDNGAPSDIGTQFALSTNLNGKNALQFAGRLGQNDPSALALCAIYTPAADMGLTNAPEVTLTASQVRMLPATQGSAEGSFMLRTMSLSLYETLDPTESLHLEYGVTGESVDFLQHTARVSPFARVTADMGKLGSIVAAYSDGGRPDVLTAHAVSKNAEPEELLDDDLAAPVNALTRTPQISMRGGRLELQRSENVEGGYSKTSGSMTYSFSAFYERVLNGRINVSGDLTSLDSGSLLSDGISAVSTYNIGNYNRDGYLASVDKRFSQNVALQVGYGRMGAFTARDSSFSGLEAGDFLSRKNHNLASIGLRARIPKAGTRLSARYGWADERSTIPEHTFTTQNIALARGLNIVIRQPLPSFFGMPGRWELMGDLRNMLSEGYLPLNEASGQRMLLVQTPKAIRGGLSITF